MTSMVSNPIAAAVIGAIEGLSGFAGQVLGTSMASCNCIETADSEFTLVAEDGSLVSGFRLDGLVSAVGIKEFEDTRAFIARELSGYLQNKGYAVQFVFERDPSAAKAALTRLTEGSRQTAKRVSLDVVDVLDSGVERLGQFVAKECAYVALWTKPEALEKELKAARLRQTQGRKGAPRISKHAQDLFAAIPDLRQKHEGFVNNLFVGLRNHKYRVVKLTAAEMLLAAREAVDPAVTPADWTPALPGMRAPLGAVKSHMKVARSPGSREADMADLQYPPIEWQVFPREARISSNRHVIVGDRAYAPMYVDLPPRELNAFGALFDRLAANNLPWRISFLLEGGGMSFATVKKQIATILRWSSGQNALIRDAVEHMQEVTATGSPCVQLRIAMATWAPADEKDLLQSRASVLNSAVTSWGQCEVREVTGNPFIGLMSTVPFLTSESIGTPAIAPLGEAVHIMPFTRPASPWSSGSMLFRTQDGKIAPFMPGSSLQTNWNYIIFASPGKGKSLLQNSIVLGSVLEAGISRLPRVAILDIGFSSLGLVQLIQDSLPEGQKHLARHIRMRMTPEYTINPFDLPVGSRTPTPLHRAFLVNLLTLAVTPPELPAAYDSMSQLVGGIIDNLYAAYSDQLSSRSAPKCYSESTCPGVDELLQQYGMVISRTTTWFEVVDFLFQKGHTREAIMAQRYAVPVLSDAVEASRAKAIEDMYGDVKVQSTNEGLIGAFQRLMSNAIRAYTVLNAPTQFDIGESRVIAIDIDEVAKKGSASADRQTQLMYMLARFVLTQDFRFTGDDVHQLFPSPDKEKTRVTDEAVKNRDLYRQYHLKRVKELGEDMKWVVYDEFHRASGSKEVVSEVVVDMREGRKWKMGVVLSSQNMADFPAEVRNLTAAAFILGSSGDAERDELQHFFGFNDTAKQLLKDHCNGPSERGAPFLAQFTTTEEGSFSQLLYSTVSPVQLWALSTTSEDVGVRKIICATLGNKEGRRYLAEFAPSGSVKKEVERLRERSALTAGPNFSAVDTYAAQRLQEYWEIRQKAGSKT